MKRNHQFLVVWITNALTLFNFFLLHQCRIHLFAGVSGHALHFLYPLLDDGPGLAAAPFRALPLAMLLVVKRRPLPLFSRAVFCSLIPNLAQALF